MDKDLLYQTIDQFYVANPEAYQLGRLTTTEEIKSISWKVKRRITKWYLELLSKYPLVDLEIGIPNDHGDETLIGKPVEELPLTGITFISTAEIERHALNIFPDYELLRMKIIRIAEDKFVTQEGVFMNGKQDNPELRLVFHDFGETGKEVYSEAETLMNSFTDMFKYAKLRTAENG
ncbi:MAG: hypothetical protein JXR03_20435 [Cyclobacteriaceae bacterium]